VQRCPLRVACCRGGRAQSLNQQRPERAPDYCHNEPSDPVSAGVQRERRESQQCVWESRTICKARLPAFWTVPAASDVLQTVPLSRYSSMGSKSVMHTRTIAACLVSLYIQFASPVDVQAQCGSGYFSLKSEMAAPSVTVVFSGTVLDVRPISGSEAPVQGRDAVLVFTFDVDRVWKGNVPKRVKLFRPVPRFPDGRGGITSLRSFDIGQKYIVLAHPLTAVERADLRIVEAEPQGLVTGVCGDGSRPYRLAEEHGDLKEIGPGREPQ
jgi:hypothetical protein